MQLVRISSPEFRQHAIHISKKLNYTSSYSCRTSFHSEPPTLDIKKLLRLVTLLRIPSPVHQFAQQIYKGASLPWVLKRGITLSESLSPMKSLSQSFSEYS